jgi:hypothetical protein
MNKLWYIIVIFFLQTVSTSQYSGIIECFIRPSREDLQSQFDSLANGVQEFDSDTIPVINYEGDQLENKGDGLSVFNNKYRYDIHNQQYKVAKKILNRSISGIDGVFGYYRGFACVSNMNGLLLFPRLELEHALVVVITNEVIPVIIQGSIPSYFRVASIEDAEMYYFSAEEVHDGLMLEWKMDKVPFEQDGRIPHNALIIISDPKSVYFDGAPRMFPYSENILLPDLFAKEDFTRGIYGIHAVDTLRYFKPLSYFSKESMLQKNVHFAHRIVNADSFSAGDI